MPKPGQRSPLRTHLQPLPITIRPEQPQLPIVAAVGLHALEALGGIVQTRRGGRDAQVLEGTQFGGVPAMVDGPADRDHVVGAVRVAEFFWTAGFGDGAEGGCIGRFDGGGVQVCGGDGAHGGGCSWQRRSIGLKKSMCIYTGVWRKQRKRKKKERKMS